MLVEFVMAVAAVFLILDSVIDLKTSEIPEKLTLGLVALTIVLALGHTVLTFNPSYILQAAAAGVLYYTIGYVLYRLNQWGGGDVKMVAGIGCVLGYLNALGYQWPNTALVPYAATYFVNMSLLAVPYALAYTLVLGLMSPKVFSEYAQQLKGVKNVSLVIVSILPSLTALYFNLNLLAAVYALLPAFALATVYLKTVEKTLLCRTIKVGELREGDIPAESIRVGGEEIASRNIEGVSEAQVKRIRGLAAKGKLPKEMKIRWGVKFGPILFLSYITTLWPGNMLEMLFRGL